VAALLAVRRRSLTAEAPSIETGVRVDGGGGSRISGDIRDLAVSCGAADLRRVLPVSRT
jgi:hypothetical protein